MQGEVVIVAETRAERVCVALSSSSSLPLWMRLRMQLQMPLWMQLQMGTICNWTVLEHLYSISSAGRPVEKFQEFEILYRYYLS